MIRNDSGSLTRLQPGHVVLLDGEKHHVVMVNDCRARCIPMAKRERVINVTATGKSVTIQSTGSGVNISPNSTVEIVGFKEISKVEK